MTCHNCKITAAKFGKDRYGNQRYKCKQCRRTFQDLKDKMLGNMYLPEAKALMVLHMLVEGNSIRSIERLTGVNRNTIMSLLVFAGEKCESVMNAYLRKGESVRRAGRRNLEFRAHEGKDQSAQGPRERLHR